MKDKKSIEFENKAKLIHNSNYNYSKSIYIHSKKELIIICNKCDKEFNQKPNVHLSGHGCSWCFGTPKTTTKEFIEKGKLIHNSNYDYSKSVYEHSKKELIIICNRCGKEFNQKPNVHLRGHGCSNCFATPKITNEKFIEKASLIHIDRNYDYSKTIYNGNKIPVIIICPMHGEFEQTPYWHLNGGYCTECNINAKKSHSQYIEEVNIIHNNKYEYISKYISARDIIEILCPIHGRFKQIAADHRNDSGCARCNSSKGEKQILKYLIDNNIIFETQKKFDMCKNKRRLPFDFYLPMYNLCIEYDGRQHFEPIEYFGGQVKFEELKRNDNIKSKFCKDNNIGLLRISYYDDIQTNLYFSLLKFRPDDQT